MNQKPRIYTWCVKWDKSNEFSQKLLYLMLTLGTGIRIYFNYCNNADTIRVRKLAIGV